VVGVGAENLYPNAIRFYLTASSTDEIEEIRVFFKKTGRVTASAYRPLIFESSDLVSAEAFLPTGRGQNYIPPGTEITYFFEIWDATGAVHRTSGQKIVYTDSRFQWATLSSGPITVYYYGEGGETQAQLAAAAAQKSLGQIAPLLGFDPYEPIRIVSYHSYDDMSEALPFRVMILEGIRTEGIAFGDERVVLIPGFDSSVKGITSHEIVHLAVAEVTGRAHSRVPAWLKEGLAEFGSLEPAAEYYEALRLGILRDSVQPLWTLDTFWRSAEYILTAYGQGHSVVRYLVSNYGEAKMAELMQAIRGSFGIDEALERVYGFDQYGLDVKWRESVGLEPLPRPEERNLPALPKPTAAPTVVPTPTPEPTSTPVRPTPTLPPTATPAPPTSTPEPTVVGTVKDQDGGRPSPGCSSSAGRSGATGGDLAMIAILAGPLAMLVFRSRRRF
jgi:hypothetical protein